MAANHAQLWDECLDLISQHVTGSQFKSFFQPIRFESFDSKSGQLVLQVPNPTIRDYLEEHFISVFREVLPSIFGNNIRLGYRVMANLPTDNILGTETEKEDTGETKLLSYLNPHYTFATFIEGDANKLARSIGLNIAEHPRSTKFNPMFIFGPSGCGKTHLINAIGLQTLALYPKKKVLYVGAREFQRQYTASVVDNKTNEFIHFYQQFDMLIVDDVQEWESSPKTSETFFHIFNHLFMNGRRIILAADRTPSELRNMDDRMLTRFACGVIAELEKPNHKLCVDILNSKIRRDGLSIPHDVVEYIARHANGSVRELEGVINSLIARSIFMSTDIDIELAEKTMGRIKKEVTGKFDVNKMLDTICEYYKVDVEDVLGNSRKREFATARQVSMYVAQAVGKVPVNRIGRLIGGRDHSTVKHSIEKVVKQMQDNKEFAREVKELMRKARHA